MNKFVVGILVVMGLIALPVACGLYSTWTSVSTAPARVVNKTLETDNIIVNYELFHDEAQQFRARINQLHQQNDFLSSEVDREEHTRLRMELAAEQQSCRELAADYNSNSKKYNRKVFKDRGLPPELDATECEITK